MLGGGKEYLIVLNNNLMNQLKNYIANNTLDKHWVRNYSLFFLTAVARSHNLINSEQFFGEIFSLAFFTYQKGESSYYRLKSENQVFLEKFGNRIIAEESFKEMILVEYKAKCDKILLIYSEIDSLNKISPNFLKNISNAFAEVVCYQLVVHRIVDYLTQSKGTKMSVDQFITIRTKYESIFGDLELNMSKIFKVLVNQTGLSHDVLKLFSADELILYLQGVVVDIKQIKLRENACVINTLPRLEIIYSQNANEILDLIKDNIQKQYEQSTLTGKAVLQYNSLSGIAICISKLEDVENVDISGKILVTHSTIPKYNHLYTKALAIIVEEGGILAHASVLAREFKIPTIVGVKNALRQIKTGESLTLQESKVTKN